jgi:aspartate racemase
MHTHSLADYMDRIYRGDWPGVAELMLSSADKLARDRRRLPDLPRQHDPPGARPRRPAFAAAVAAHRRGGRRRSGAARLSPRRHHRHALARRQRGLSGEAARARARGGAADDAERDEINRIIMDELVCSVFKPESVAYFQQVIGRMKDSGCDAVALACTEIPLIIDDERSALPTLDSTRLLARAALRGRSRADAPRCLQRYCGPLTGLAAQRLAHELEAVLAEEHLLADEHRRRAETPRAPPLRSSRAARS